MVRIRLKRMGRKHRPFFRINAIEKRAPRDGEVLEALGWYDPLASDPSKSVMLHVERIKHWISKGAQPSDTVNDILARHGLIDAEAWKQVRARRAAGKIAAMAKAKAAAPPAGQPAAEAAAGS